MAFFIKTIVKAYYISLPLTKCGTDKLVHFILKKDYKNSISEEGLEYDKESSPSYPATLVCWWFST